MIQEKHTNRSIQYFLSIPSPSIYTCFPRPLSLSLVHKSHEMSKTHLHTIFTHQIIVWFSHRTNFFTLIITNMDSKLIKHKAFPKTLLLKDYLLDDMSSCSSNGFSSFPRKQCCTTTVRFLIEIDLKNIKQPKKYFIFNKRKHKPSKFPISAFHTAIAAVKRLPFSAAGGSPEKNTLMKILKKSVFWKRKPNFDEIGRWKSLDQLMKESSESLDIPNSSITAAAVAATNDSGNSSCEVNLSCTKVERNNDDGNDDDNVEVMIKDGDVSADSTTSSDGGATGSSTKVRFQ